MGEVYKLQNLNMIFPMELGTGQPVMVILESPLGRSYSDARAKSEANLRRHTFVR